MLNISKTIFQGAGLASVLLKRTHTVELDWDVRQKSRFDCTDSAGRQLGVFLLRGTAVRGGDFLVVEDGSLVRVLEHFPNADIVFVESGGDNLAATFSPELSDLTIYVIDVAAGEKIPRKGGPGITKSDLFVINKTDLAPYVGANLDVMEADTQRMRPTRPYVMTNLKTLTGVSEVVSFIKKKGMLSDVE